MGGKKNWWVKRELAQQRREDAGIGLIDLHATMGATWGYSLRRSLEPEARPWKHFVPYYLRKVYGAELGAGTRLLTSNYSFTSIVDLPRGAITEKMRQAFKAQGSLPRMKSVQRAWHETPGDAEQQRGSAERHPEVFPPPARRSVF